MLMNNKISELPVVTNLPEGNETLFPIFLDNANHANKVISLAQLGAVIQKLVMMGSPVEVTEYEGGFKFGFGKSVKGASMIEEAIEDAVHRIYESQRMIKICTDDNQADLLRREVRESEGAVNALRWALNYVYEVKTKPPAPLLIEIPEESKEAEFKKAWYKRWFK